MKNLNEYEQYFSWIVEHYTKLKSFYHIDIFDFNQFQNDLRGGKFVAPMLVLESYTIDTVAQHLDNVHDVLDGALVVLGKYDIKEVNRAARTAFLSEMEEIVKQIRNKMLLDKKNTCGPMFGLIPTSINISKTEIIAGGFQGYRMTFTIEHPTECVLNNDWV